MKTKNFIINSKSKKKIKFKLRKSRDTLFFSSNLNAERIDGVEDSAKIKLNGKLRDWECRRVLLILNSNFIPKKKKSFCFI